MKTAEALYPHKLRRLNHHLRVCDPHSRKSVKLDRQREEFLALFAHELLTPLTCILGWSQLAHDQLDLSAIRHAFDVIERNARRQKSLLDELLSVLRYSRGNSLSFNPRQIDLWHLVEQYKEQTLPPTTELQLSLPLDDSGKFI